jgi:hypothetical protein
VSCSLGRISVLIRSAPNSPATRVWKCHKILPVRPIHSPAPRHGFDDVDHSEALAGSVYLRVTADFLRLCGWVIEANKHVRDYGISTPAYGILYRSQRRRAAFVETQHRRFALLIRPIQAQNDPRGPRCE